MAAVLGPSRCSYPFRHHLHEIHLLKLVCLQFPDNALVHRKEFLRDYIATGKIKVGAFSVPGVGYHCSGWDAAVRFLVMVLLKQGICLCRRSSLMLPLLTWEMWGTSQSIGRSLKRSMVLVWRFVLLPSS